ncbi:MAG: dihydroorotate dehydrogenase electron transfer subunit [Methanotrichaceae archaeon]|nr:dihydroorotate dehydrogenase electron transfer subunit [Methanotrichaceae archaeon]
MRPSPVRIVEIIEETSTVKTIRFDSARLDPLPGQYMMVWIRGVDEIPMSFSGPSEMTVAAVGEATRALFRLRPGDGLGLRGPYGNGFSLIGDRILLIGGGVGAAPLAFLGDVARHKGIEVTSLMGFRCSEDIIFKRRFERLGELILTTDDGSSGIPGRVSLGLERLDPDRFSQIYICGPELMMWDVIERWKDHAGKMQASVNRHFKCGIGICGSCCMDPTGIRVCQEGPVIPAVQLLEGEFGRYRRGPSGSRGPPRG